MEKKELDKILEDHEEWIVNFVKGERANLRDADLRGANLNDANLRGADLNDANLGGADLNDADLGGANLRYADLNDANLRGANLRGADLGGANLRYANLNDADLRGANLRDADLRGANLRGADLNDADLNDADLGGANLRDANFRGANLRGANLRYANLRGADLPYFENIPQTGSFIAWKKGVNGCLIKLEIPAKAKRTSNLRNRKCRAEYVKVLKILDGENKSIKKCKGQYDKNTIYEVGKITKPDKYCDDIRLDCSHGIHFFVTEKEAKEW